MSRHTTVDPKEILLDDAHHILSYLRSTLKEYPMDSPDDSIRGITNAMYTCVSIMSRAVDRYEELQ